MHPLDGSRLKVSRAFNQLDTLDQSIKRFLETNPYGIVGNRQEKPGWYVMRAKVIKEIDPILGVIIGEIAHDLKSALHGMVWQLAKLDSRVFSKRTEFPIYLHKRDSPFSKRHPSGSIKELSLHHVAMLEKFQPYKRRNSQRRNSLFLLYELNRADKHRTIQIIGGHTINANLLSPTHPDRLGLANFIIRGRNRSFINGTKLAECKIDGLDSDTKMHFQGEVQVQFAQGCDAVKKLRVVPTLRSIADHVMHVIDSFKNEF